MLVVLSHNQCDVVLQSQLAALAVSTPVLLCGDGVYRFFSMAEGYPELAIHVLAEDAMMRGIKVPSEHLVDYRQWVALSHQFYPWVSL